MRILVTAGPTREFIDDVRFISNPSSGKTGYAIAEEARRRGHTVTLVNGPVALPPPAGVRVVPVVSARDMHRAVLRAFASVDAVIMTAAVGDFEQRRVRGKIKKNGRGLTIRLRPTPDILKTLGARKGRRILVGFALEVRNRTANALAKLRAKRLDLIVANGPATFRSEKIRATLVAPAYVKRLPILTKREFARQLVRIVEEIGARGR